MSVKTVQAVINGQTYNLTLNSSTGKYEATITAPGKSSYTLSGHYYPVTVKATDDAGNTTTKTDSDATLGSSLKLQVKEKVAPVIAITAPTAGSYIINSKPAITFKITDDDSGVNPTTIGITIDSGSKITEIPSQRKQYQVVTNVHTHQTRHCLTEAIRSRLMHLIMTAMQQSRNPLHSRSIQYRRHCPLLHRLMVLLQIRRHAQSKVLPTMLLPARLQ